MGIRVEPPARDEIIRASEYYDSVSQDIGIAFNVGLKSAFASIEQNPNAWSPLRGGVRRYVMKRFPYQLIYRVEADEIVIYAVAHQSRRPGYWRRRVKAAKP